MATDKGNLRGTTSDLAKWIGVSQRRCNQLCDQGIITREPEGDFLLPDAIAQYYAYKFKPDQAVDYMEEKALHERAKRAMAELDLRQREHQLHEADDVRAVMTEMLVNLRTQLLGIPAKMANVLQGKEKADIEELLRLEIESRLLELKDYEPTMFDAKEDEENDS